MKRMTIISLVVVILSFVLKNYLLLIALIPVVVYIVVNNFNKAKVEEVVSETKKPKLLHI